MDRRTPLTLAIWFSLLCISSYEKVNGQVTPNDPGLSNQTYLGTVNAQSAWSIASDAMTAQGDQIVIAVLDQGIDLDHPDLNYWVNADEVPGNGIDDDSNGYVDDVRGWDAVDGDGDLPADNHGTRCAGTIGAKANNGIGMAGICWGVLIMPVRVQTSSPSSVVAGYEYVLAQKRKYLSTNGASGAFIVATNLSLSLLNSTPDDYPEWCAIYDELGSAGILNINAPKNRNREIGVSSPTPFDDLPALCSSEYLVVVTATTPADNLIEGNGATGSPWSQTHVDIAAPGQDIYSTADGGGYDSDSGTSFAAPLVAGTVALMYSAACDELIARSKLNPAQTALEMKNAILNNSDPVGGLFLLIRRGRLNVNRALLSITEQQSLDRNVTGAAQQSYEFRAIRNITIEDYSHLTSSQVRCIAGRSIVLEALVDIGPTGFGSADLTLNPARFDCSVPYAPVSVSLATPNNINCDIPMVWANAAAYGGLTPYSFQWQTRLTSVSSWTTRSATGNALHIGGLHDGDFYVRVRVTDSNGTQAWSSTNLVVCTSGMTLEDDEGAIEALLPDVSAKLRTSMLLTVAPNPVESILRIERIAGLKPTHIRLYDEQGRLLDELVETIAEHDMSQYATFDATPLAAGCYLLRAQFGDAVGYARFIKLQ